MTDETTGAAPAAAPASEAVATPAPAETTQTTGETPAPAVSTEGAPATPPGDDAAAEPRHKGGFQKRISELTSDKRRLEREADHWREMALKGQTPTPAATSDAAPQAENFATYDEYVHANARWAARQELKAEQGRTEQQRTEREALEVEQKFMQRCDAASERYADFNDAVGAMMSDDTYPISPAVAHAVKTSEKGPDLAYWLANNRQEAARLSQLSPLAAAMELGRVAATLQTPAKRTVTQVPPPPTTIRGGDVPTVDVNAMSKNVDATQLIEHWRSQKRA